MTAEPAVAPRSVLAPNWAWFVATFLGAGKLRPGPGTWGSLAALGLWNIAAPILPPGLRTPAALLGAAFTFCVGAPAGARVARQLGSEDPSCVVIDEVCGQMLALAAVPLHWKSQLAAFILFRAFDIVKPPPLRRLERVSGGWGIMLDDVGAGLCALIVMQLLLHFGVLQ
jgi:phosphatidylglycerophosphatase A